MWFSYSQFVLTLCAICCTLPLLADDVSHDSDRYNEVMLQPVAASDYDPEQEEDCNCNRDRDTHAIPRDTWTGGTTWVEEPEPWAYVSVFGGGTVTDSATRNGLGGQYGVFGYKPLTSAVAAFGSANLNHFDDGTQVGGTLGLFKITAPSRHLADRVGWSVNYDQFTDTSAGSPYVGALRYDVHLRQNGVFTTGLRYSHTVTGGSVPGAVPGAGAVPLTPFDLIEGYVNASLGKNNLTAGVGYLDEQAATSWRLSGTRRLTKRLSGLLQANYNNDGDWNGFFGLSWDIHGDDSESLGCTTCSRQMPNIVVRAQNGSFSTLGGVRRDVASNDDPVLIGLLDDLIEEFGANQPIPNEFARQIRQDSAKQHRANTTASESGRSGSSGDSVIARLEDMAASLRKNPNKFANLAQQQLLTSLFSQNQLQNFVNQRRTTSGSSSPPMSSCPVTLPFRVLSGGGCFCCDNAAGTGICITCP